MRPWGARRVTSRVPCASVAPDLSGTTRKIDSEEFIFFTLSTDDIFKTKSNQSFYILLFNTTLVSINKLNMERCLRCTSKKFIDDNLQRRVEPSSVIWGAPGIFRRFENMMAVSMVFDSAYIEASSTPTCSLVLSGWP